MIFAAFADGPNNQIFRDVTRATKWFPTLDDYIQKLREIEQEDPVGNAEYKLLYLIRVYRKVYLK